MAMLTRNEIPEALAAIAAGRDHVPTNDFGKATLHADQTIRKNYSPPMATSNSPTYGHPNSPRQDG
jgi:hypothetical protein